MPFDIDTDSLAVVKQELPEFPEMFINEFLFTKYHLISEDEMQKQYFRDS